jgi:hypothetical protein
MMRVARTAISCVDMTVGRWDVARSGEKYLPLYQCFRLLPRNPVESGKCRRKGIFPDGLSKENPWPTFLPVKLVYFFSGDVGLLSRR